MMCGESYFELFDLFEAFGAGSAGELAIPACKVLMRAVRFIIGGNVCRRIGNLAMAASAASNEHLASAGQLACNCISPRCVSQRSCRAADSDCDNARRH